MSADNGIYVLVTTDKFRREGLYLHNMLPHGITTYRVAYAHGIDNLEWLEHNEPYNVGYFLHIVWKDSPPLYNKIEVEKEIKRLERLYKHTEYGDTEYGVNWIDRKQYNFPS